MQGYMYGIILEKKSALRYESQSDLDLQFVWLRSR